MKDTLIAELLKPLNDVLDKHMKDVNGDDMVSYLTQSEQNILADVSLAVDTVRKDLDNLFTDMLSDDSYDDLKVGDDKTAYYSWGPSKG